MKKVNKKDSPPIEPAKEAMEDYDTKYDLETLVKAEMIKEHPEKMAKVKKLAGRHHKALTGIKDFAPPSINSIEDIKQIKNKKYGV